MEYKTKFKIVRFKQEYEDLIKRLAEMGLRPFLMDNPSIEDYGISLSSDKLEGGALSFDLDGQLELVSNTSHLSLEELRNVSLEFEPKVKYSFGLVYNIVPCDWKSLPAIYKFHSDLIRSASSVSSLLTSSVSSLLIKCFGKEISNFVSPIKQLSQTARH